jgi:hypothetical protein
MSVGEGRFSKALAHGNPGADFTSYRDRVPLALGCEVETILRANNGKRIDAYGVLNSKRMVWLLRLPLVGSCLTPRARHVEQSDLRLG